MKLYFCKMALHAQNLGIGLCTYVGLLNYKILGQFEQHTCSNKIAYILPTDKGDPLLFMFENSVLNNINFCKKYLI